MLGILGHLFSKKSRGTASPGIVLGKVVPRLGKRCLWAVNRLSDSLNGPAPQVKSWIRLHFRFLHVTLSMFKNYSFTSQIQARPDG
ncbi:hypothetical protein [Deinococcus marmoris]|uniref:hypothetical protein n=1 Tax=Deinococcus marmoris TaxID=249408 RepID=UPI000AAAE500|nr:hypothetical protein [Deinococcus marmoris]